MTNLITYANKLKNTINTISKDFAENVGYYNSFDDAISEFADGEVDIYYSDRAKWFAENWEKVNETNAELGTTGDVMQDIAQAQFIDAQMQLYSDIDNIILIMACEYLVSNEVLELSDEDLETLNNIDTCVDQSDNLDDIADYCRENFLNKEAE